MKEEVKKRREKIRSGPSSVSLRRHEPAEDPVRAAAKADVRFAEEVLVDFRADSPPTSMHPEMAFKTAFNGHGRSLGASTGACSLPPVTKKAHPHMPVATLSRCFARAMAEEMERDESRRTVGEDIDSTAALTLSLD